MLARYSILNELGRGAIGAVYAARDRTTGGVVALKRLDPALVESDPGFAERFLKHARAAQRLRHPNIVRIHDTGEAAGTAYVAMEMLEGENLRSILDHGPLPLARAIRIVDEIACGLAYAHLQGLMHGGLKPSDIIVLPSGAVKITDFGTGQLGQAALLSGAPAGGLAYRSPEQVRGDPVDYRSDVFSLGALFYEMLTRRRAFEGNSPQEITENILHAEPPPPSELNRNVPRALDAMVSSMLARQVAARMPGIPVLLRELQGLEEGLGLGPAASTRADEPAASAPPAAPEPEPGPRTPEFRDASAFGIPPDSSPADDFQHRQITDHEVLEYARARRQPGSGRERPARSRAATLAALALVLAVVGIGLTYFMRMDGFIDGAAGFIDDWSARIEQRIAATRMQEAPATAGASRPAAPPPVAEAPKEPVTAPPAPEASPSGSVRDGTDEQESSAVASAPEPMPAKPLASEPRPAPQAERKSPAKLPTRALGKTARVILAISPRGEIYIDGEHQGTTPPITTLDLQPGMHRIEVRSGSRTPYLTYVTVQAGDVRHIRYDFDAKGSRPPR